MEVNEQTPQDIDRGYAFVILTVCCILRFIGTAQSVNYGVFLNEWADALQANNKQLLLILSVQNVVLLPGCLSVAPIVERIGYRLTLVAGLVIQAVGYAGAGVLNAQSVWLMVLWLGVVAGCGSALVTVATQGLSGHFFVERRTLWSLSTMTAFYLGIAARVPALRYLLDAFGPFSALTVWAAVPFGSVLFVLLLREPVKRAEQNRAAAIPDASAQSSPYKALLRAPFALFMVGIVLLTSFDAARDLLSKYGESEMAMSGAMSALSVTISTTVSLVVLLLLTAATASKRLSRYIPVDATMIVAMLLSSLAAVAVAFTYDDVLYIALLMVILSCNTIAVSMEPAALVNRVGANHVTAAYGILFAGGGAGAASFGLLSGIVVDATGSVRPYFPITAVLVTAGAIAFGCSALLARRRSRVESTSASGEMLALPSRASFADKGEEEKVQISTG